jgi:ABC-type microcin C transport system permease subunit YejE
MTMSDTQTLRGWLLSETPTSRRHARLSALYQGWLAFRGNTMAMIGLSILVALTVIALGAPWIAPHDPFAQDLGNRLGPLWAPGHPLGTDSLGRDILSRLIHGSRITLYIVALVALIAPIAGLLVGTVSGYVGGWTDMILMRITDIFLAFPRLVLALAFVAALGAGIENAVLAISLTAWPAYARIARAETLTIRSSDYISAIKRGAGAHHHQAYLAAVHILADRAGDAGHGGDHSGRRGAGVLGPWRATAQPRMGGDDLRRAAIHPRLLVGGDGARPRDFHGVAGVQPARGRAARRARPEFI